MNFGETLAYWYFRLNGFFPLSNFVLHRPRGGTGQNADCDLLAVRFPNVHETVGGQKDDWDNRRFDEWRLGHRDKVIGIVAEVKTGRYQPEAIRQSFSKERLEHVIQRLGILPKCDIRHVVQILLKNPAYSDERVTVAKVLVDSIRHHRQEGNENGGETCPPNYCWLPLEDIETFINRRMKKYKGPKCGARMFFMDDLIQYFAWKSQAD